MPKEKLISLLKEYGNVYVRERDYNIDELSKETGLDLDIRFAKNCEIGWVIYDKKRYR